MAQKKTSLNYQLVRVKTEQFATIDNIFKEDKEIEIKTSLSFEHSTPLHIIKVFSKFELLQEGNIFLILAVSCSFEIENITWDNIRDKKNNNITLPQQLAISFATVNIDTARGMLVAKTQQTQYQNILIPLIQFADSIKDNIIIASVD